MNMRELRACTHEFIMEEEDDMQKKAREGWKNDNLA